VQHFTPRASPYTDRPAITIGDITLGTGRPPAFWPDIDLYFKRDLTKALDLISRLANSGCRFLKAAALHDVSVCLPGDHLVSFFDATAGLMRTEPYAKVMERHVLPLVDLARLAARARSQGLNLVLSVYDEEGLRFALEEGAAAVKIPSSNVTHLPLIEEAAKSGLPIVLDTGRARWAEIERAVGWVTAAGGSGRLLIQHSPPGPPAAPSRYHLGMLTAIAEAFDRPIGLSDHHSGLDMIPIAVALGACVIEKGLTSDGTEGDIDIAHALPASRAGEALTLIENSFEALGNVRRPDEEATPDPARMGIFAARFIAAGEMLNRECLRFAFPAVGLGTEAWGRVCGARARQSIAQGAPISEADI
jgi:N,N'-diacetyllegionaminate synthase